MSTFKIQERKDLPFFMGAKDGIPIGLGYFAVSFSLGIAAQRAGLSPFQAFLSSFLCSASAGQYVDYTLIAVAASYLQVAVMTLIANARYLLMSCAMSQRISPNTRMIHRFAMSFAITDELFAINIVRPGYLNPYYFYGSMAVAVPMWAIGTALGTTAGNIMPLRAVSALSVALYGMFLAVIIPPTRSNKIITGLILISFTLSFAGSYLPVFAQISSGTRTIFLTVVISAVAAVLFPVKQREVEEA